MKDKLIIGTRGSELALWQAYTVRDALRKVCPTEIEVKVISTRGDERLEIALHSNQLSKGLFTEELEAELLSGEIDFAVHSLKDLPVEMPQGLMLAATLKRADPRDVVIASPKINSIQELSGKIIGTSSPRRVAQLKYQLSDGTTFKPIRGNVQTRIHKLETEDYDAIIMAAAGIQRLGLEDKIAFYIPLEEVLPAPGQACVAVQCASNNTEACHWASAINDSKAMLETSVERQLLLALGGGCALPLGALCERISDTEVKLSAAYANQDFSKVARETTSLSIEHLDVEIGLFASRIKKGVE